jgi:alkylation response protein AidB-like acyl-CoA dehydrogenase
MARQVDASHSHLENVTYQLTQMSHSEANSKLGGPIALLKAQATTVFEYCAREAAQIFGGYVFLLSLSSYSPVIDLICVHAMSYSLAYTRGGQGEKVERLYREVRAYAIPAGSEEIMLDLGIRQAIKKPTSKL